jgi:hypothetical protein
VDYLTDATGDGIVDYALGSPTSPGGGAVFLAAGPVTGRLDLAESATKVVGAQAGGGAGFSVAGVDDADGDGLSDVLVGAPWVVDDKRVAGSAYLLLAPFDGLTTLAEADATLVGARGDFAGYSVAGPGDLDGDGRDDLLVGAPHGNQGVTGCNAGAAHAVLGTAVGVAALADAGATLSGEAWGDCAGYSVAGARDLTGDAWPDVVISAPIHEYGESLGAVYVMTGALGW